MKRIEVRIIAAPAVAETLVRHAETALAPTFTVTGASGPRPARKSPGCVIRYLTVTAEAGWAVAEARNGTELAEALEAAEEELAATGRLADELAADLESEVERNDRLRLELASARDESEALYARLARAEDKLKEAL